ncbi:hypothetical protein FNV43_RR09808 [Rhamnella rubrinervis]|uniref:Uncharacterized protein n=1 Tax=Rhamnella rubrinervis TaxID=2594499 RepID=A0A8K0HBY9_9ROSA|nr:hypothetical protein FNV43_RR09808 [Rhamnella rubrinervis]
MGIWDYICSSADSLKRNAPDLKPIRDLYSTSYAHGSSAATSIGNAVKDNANKLHTLTQYLPDQEAQHKIFRFTSCLAKNAAFESVKFFPGGEFTRKIVAMSYEDVYKSKNDNDQVQVEKKKALDGTQGRGRSKM